MSNSHKNTVAGDAHAPAAHAASHESGGSDEIDVTGLTGAGGSASPPNCYIAELTTDVAIPSANTAQDILSLSLPAGDYAVFAGAEITSANTNQTQLTIGIHNGTSIVANAQVVQQSGVGGISQHAECFARITLAGTTTVKLQAYDVRGSSDGTVKDVATSNGTADKGTKLMAIEVTAA